MGNWNAERFLSCIYILRGLEIWGACVFGCLTSDTYSLICMNIMHPELLLRSKKTAQRLCKNRLLASRTGGKQTLCIFQKSGSASLIRGGHWIKCRLPSQQLLVGSTSTYGSKNVQLNPSYNFWRLPVDLLLSLLYFIYHMIWGIFPRA